PIFLMKYGIMPIPTAIGGIMAASVQHKVLLRSNRFVPKEIVPLNAMKHPASATARFAEMHQHEDNPLPRHIRCYQFVFAGGDNGVSGKLICECNASPDLEWTAGSRGICYRHRNDSLSKTRQGQPEKNASRHPEDHGSLPRGFYTRHV